MDNLVIRKRLSEKVAENLQSQIQSGAFELNHQLPNENELMKIYQVGRSTIRDAILQLSFIGLVSAQQGKGTFIKAAKNTWENSLVNTILSASDTDTSDVFRIIQFQVIRNAALNRTKKDMSLLQTSLNKLKNQPSSANPWTEIINALFDFKKLLISACHNKCLSELYSIFLERRKIQLLAHNNADANEIATCIAHHEFVFHLISERRHDIDINLQDIY